ncbi:MAG TPA: prolipoprotein diacylglyceryl transferase [Bacteroidales bacterium]|nr:prolipoprotein diacylglyceryl transferase [Bacteroidales bacterium]HPT11141.1 prolipoprotein diacylglyceryl transferase [Bacteroidales bacterium]
MTLEVIYWNIDPEIVNIFGISIRYYSLFFTGGLIVSAIILQKLFVWEDLSVEHFDRLIIYCGIGILAGARLGHCLFYQPSYFLLHPVEMLLPIQQQPDGGYKFIGYQGLASHGGALGLVIAIIFYCYKCKQSLLATIDLIAIVAPLGAGFIRLANLMNSEILGMPSNVPWAFVFTMVDNTPRHPAQLYEAVIYLIIFVIMLFIKVRHGKVQSGLFLGLSLTMIFGARFMIEFIKERQVIFEYNMALDMGQILSIPFIATGIAFIFFALIKDRNAEKKKAVSL